MCNSTCLLGLALQRQSGKDHRRRKNLRRDGTRFPAFTAFRCDSLTRCYAFASSLLAISTDEGAHWRTLLTVPDAPTHVTIVSGACPTLTDCFVLGRTVDQSHAAVITERPYAAHTTDGGRTWSSFATPSAQAEWGDARCLTDTTCYGLANALESGIAGIVTTNGGQSWSTMSTIPAINVIQGFSCPAERVCIVAGAETSGPQLPSSVEVTTNGGATWHTTLTSDTATLSPVSCTGNGRCVVGVTYVGERKGAAIELSTNFGDSWTVVPFPRVS